MKKLVSAFLISGMIFGLQEHKLNRKFTMDKEDKSHELKKSEIETPVVEDLMREHGLLNRVLLIYEEIMNRLVLKKEFDKKLVFDAATIIKDFIENYHEKLEEQYIFPRLTRARKYTSMIKELLLQHKKGRALTKAIRRITSAKTDLSEKQKAKLLVALEEFIFMYRAHESREDTEIFPEFKKLITQKEYEELSELFESIEHKLFGKDGFEAILKRVEILEKALNISNLAHYTPDIPVAPPSGAI